MNGTALDAFVDVMDTQDALICGGCINGANTWPKDRPKVDSIYRGPIHDQVNGRSSTNGLRVPDTGENASSSHATLVVNSGESGRGYWRNERPSENISEATESKVRRWPQHSHSLQKGPDGRSRETRTVE